MRLNDQFPGGPNVSNMDNFINKTIISQLNNNCILKKSGGTYFTNSLYLETTMCQYKTFSLMKSLRGNFICIKSNDVIFKLLLIKRTFCFSLLHPNLKTTRFLFFKRWQNWRSSGVALRLETELCKHSLQKCRPQDFLE